MQVEVTGMDTPQHHSKNTTIVIVPRTVHLLSQPDFTVPPQHPFTTDTTNAAQQMIEFAGRSMYQTWSKDRKVTHKNSDYLKHLLTVGNKSVFDHAHYTIYITGISRDLAHEFYRFQNLTITELSPRYIPENYLEVALPAVLHPYKDQIEQALRDQYEAYATCAHHIAHHSDTPAKNPTETSNTSAPGSAKHIHHALMGLIPRMSATEITVSGSVNAWRSFISQYGNERADRELRSLSVEILEKLSTHAPTLFADFITTDLGDQGVMTVSVLMDE